MILPVIRAGETVTIVWQLFNPVPTPVLYDPPSPPQITILDPNGTQQVVSANMTRVSQGLYRYDFQTPATGALGTWTMFVNATDALGNPSGSAFQGTPPSKYTPAFTLV